MRKPDVERPLGRPRLRWVDDIKVNFIELGCESVDWFNLYSPCVLPSRTLTPKRCI